MISLSGIYIYIKRDVISDTKDGTGSDQLEKPHVCNGPLPSPDPTRHKQI